MLVIFTLCSSNEKAYMRRKNAAVCSCRHSKSSAIARGVYGVCVCVW